MASAINSTRSENEEDLNKHRAEMARNGEEIVRLQEEETCDWPSAKTEDAKKKMKAGRNGAKTV